MSFSLYLFTISQLKLCLLCSAWIAEDQIWPYVEFKSKFMIIQKVPQGFREAVNNIEEQLHTGDDTKNSDLVCMEICI